MDILKGFEEHASKVREQKEILRKIEKERITWCDSNRKEIKSLYPKKGKIYELDICKEDLPYLGISQTDIDENSIYYFKTEDTRFNPRSIFMYGSGIYPTVRGDILDVNLKVVYKDFKASIVKIKPITPSNDPSTHSNKITKIYVMVDKNTGYYKIGRSKNPKYRESTLQSEKPTIEMLFFHDARNKDEKILHDLFKEKRVRGEWFDLSGSDLSKIKEYFK